MQFICKKIVVERRVSLAFERGFHADVTVNNVKRRRSPFYFVHTRSCFLAKMIFFLETNRFSPFQRAFLVSSQASDITDVTHGIPTDTWLRTTIARIRANYFRTRSSKIFFDGVDARVRRVPIFFVNGTKTGKIAFKLRSQKLSETIAASILVSRPKPRPWLHPSRVRYPTPIYHARRMYFST